MKKYSILYLIILVLFNSACTDEDQTKKAWESINTPENREILRETHIDSLNFRSPRTPNDMAHDVRHLFKTQRLNDQKGEPFNLVSLRDSLFQVEGMPGECKDLISGVLNVDVGNSAPSINIDSAEAKIIECLFVEMFEKKMKH